MKLSLDDPSVGARIYDLAYPLDASVPTSGSLPPFEMRMMRHHGDVVLDDLTSGAFELLSLSAHTGTHIDALCHVAHDGLMHDGIDAAQASSSGRFAVLGAESIAPIVCRGVMLDVAAVNGAKTLDPRHSITAADLDAACRSQRVTVRPGNAVLVRTGWAEEHVDDPDALRGTRTGAPGVGLSGARWLAAKGACVTGSDTLAYESVAPDTSKVSGASTHRGPRELPVHRHLLVDCGILIIELLRLGDLCRDSVGEFLFIAAPLKLTGATGSPLRPLAIVADGTTADA